ncbi:hypothetical protein D3C85_1395150 [compost metagenome]
MKQQGLLWPRTLVIHERGFTIHAEITRPFHDDKEIITFASFNDVRQLLVNGAKGVTSFASQLRLYFEVEVLFRPPILTFKPIIELRLRIPQLFPTRLFVDRKTAVNLLLCG